MSKKASNKGFTGASYLNRSEYVGGNLGIPDKVKCDRCKRFKNQAGYSNKRLADLQERIRCGLSAVVTCSECLGGQVQELECHICQEWKGLEDFAKAQRKNPDHAKCNSCMNVQLDSEAFDESGDLVRVAPGKPDPDDYDSDDDDQTLSTSMAGDSETSGCTQDETFIPHGSRFGELIPGLDDLSINDTSSVTSSVATTTTGAWSRPSQSVRAPSSNMGRGSSSSARAPSSSIQATSSSVRGPSYTVRATSTSVLTPQPFNSLNYGHPRGPDSPAGSAGSPVGRSPGGSGRSRRVSKTNDQDLPIRPSADRFAKVKAYREPKKLQTEEEKSVSYASMADDESSDEDFEI